MAILPNSAASLPRRGRSILLVGLVAVAAIALRSWRLGWGLDQGLCFPDEEIFWGRPAAGFVPLSRTSFEVEELPYPTLYRYLSGLAVSLAHALGALDASAPFPLEAVRIARMLSATAGVATVAIVGLLASRLYGTRVGIAAAALWAVVPLEVVQVHYASVDVLLTLACTLTLLASFGLASRGRALDAAFAGAAAGLASTAKYTGAVMLATVAWAILEATWRDRSARRLAARATAALGGLAAAVLAGCPPCVLRPELSIGAIHWWRFVDARAFSGFPNAHLAPSLGWYGRPYLYQLVASLPYALGWPVHLLALLGLAVALRRRELADRLLLAGVLPFFLVMGSANVTYPRYLLPLCTGLVVLAARAGAGTLPLPRLRGAILAAAWAYSAVLSASQVARTSYDQQIELARWLADGLGPGTRTSVGVPAFAQVYYRLCEPLRERGIACVGIADEEWLEAPTAVLVVPHWYEIAIRRDQPGSAASLALEEIAAGATRFREVGRFESWYLDQGLYRRLDPAFAVELTQGAAGFTVYARGRARGVLARHPPP